MVVEQTITVFELKQIILGKVFESQANFPRVGLMTNSNSFYTLEYICQQGKRARYHMWLRLLICFNLNSRVEDDESKLFELNMALPLFKMISIDEGIKNVETETDIGASCPTFSFQGLLSGRKLSTFESTRSPEVNDFRWTVKVPLAFSIICFSRSLRFLAFSLICSSRCLLQTLQKQDRPGSPRAGGMFWSWNENIRYNWSPVKEYGWLPISCPKDKYNYTFR